MAEVKADIRVDASGLNCPMPVLKAKKALDGLAPGQVLEFIATDSGTKTDIPALLKRLGHELLSSREENGKYIFYILKR